MCFLQKGGECWSRFWRNHIQRAQKTFKDDQEFFQIFLEFFQRFSKNKVGRKITLRKQIWHKSLSGRISETGNPLIGQKRNVYFNMRQATAWGWGAVTLSGTAWCAVFALQRGPSLPKFFRRVHFVQISFKEWFFSPSLFLKNHEKIPKNSE